MLLCCRWHDCYVAQLVSSFCPCSAMQGVCYQYWPNSKVEVYGEITVHKLTENQLNGYVERTLRINVGKVQNVDHDSNYYIDNSLNNSVACSSIPMCSLASLTR